jgi:uncharacterized protein DUF3179
MHKLLTALSIILFLQSCELLSPETNQPVDIVRENGNIFIVDRTNKEWDVTHAVNVYGFKPESFQYGLGPRAIQPINNPQMLSSGQSGYPGSNNTNQIIGTTLKNDTRAYPLNVLSQHEMVNEKFGTAYVGVAY